jgi:hypothetical protein
MWRLYRQDHRLSGDDLSDIAVEHVATDKRVLYHTLSRADLDAGLDNSRGVASRSDSHHDRGIFVEDLSAIFGCPSRRLKSPATARQLLIAFARAPDLDRVLPAPQVKDVP